MGIKDKITEAVDKVTGDSDDANIPHRQPDGDPPVPPVEVPDPDAMINVDPSAKA